MMGSVYQCRKGQFFIVSAIIIIIFMYALSNILTTPRTIDYSKVQDNKLSWMVDDIESGLYQITMVNLTYQDDIEEYIEFQSELAILNGYDFEFDLTFNPYTSGYFSVYTVSLASHDSNILKENYLLPYYSYCNDGLVCIVEAMGFPGYEGYSRACCKAYTLCC